jgi:hypothetical protein
MIHTSGNVEPAGLLGKSCLYATDGNTDNEPDLIADLPRREVELRG